MTCWPPSDAASQSMKALPISAWAVDARAPYKACAGFNNGSFASSEPFLKIFSLDLTASVAVIQVPRSVRVYSERRDAASKDSRGNRGY